MGSLFLGVMWLRDAASGWIFRRFKTPISRGLRFGGALVEGLVVTGLGPESQYQKTNPSNQDRSCNAAQPSMNKTASATRELIQLAVAPVA
jgi:hypothetical protein